MYYDEQSDDDGQKGGKMMVDKGKKIKTTEIQYGWCEAEESWLPMTECSGCIYHFFDDTSRTSYCRWEKPSVGRRDGVDTGRRG